MGACQSSQSTIDGDVAVGNKPHSQQPQMKVSTTQETFPRDVSETETDSQNNQQQQHHLQHAVSSPIVGTTKLVPIKSKEKDRTDFYKNRPGYSSGGSSFHDTSSEEDMDVVGRQAAAVADADAAPLLSSILSTRQQKLKEWKTEIAGTGDLTQRIVHIEVSSTLAIFSLVNVTHLKPRAYANPLFFFVICSFALRITHRRTLVETLRMYTKVYMTVLSLVRAWLVL
jgi:hypothetical protein